MSPPVSARFVDGRLLRGASDVARRKWVGAVAKRDHAARVDVVRRARGVAEAVARGPLQPRAKSKLQEAMNAPTRKAADAAIDDFASSYGEKYPKAAKSLVDGREARLTCVDFPAAHWKHLRTTNPIESTLATVRLRTRVTKGPGPRNAGLAMVFKRLLAAEKTWRKLDGHALVALVRAGAR
nr:transposase [Polyangium spumosum]